MRNEQFGFPLSEKEVQALRSALERQSTCEATMLKSFLGLRKIWMQHLMKNILTTKITKATKGSDIFDYKLRALRVLRGRLCFFRLALFWLGLCRTRFSVVKYVCLGLVLFASPMFPSSAVALEVPALNTTINDFAKMMRPASSTI